MAYPDDIYEQRELENLPGLIYDPGNKKTLFAEDIMNIGNDLSAIEAILNALSDEVRIIRRSVGANYILTEYSDGIKELEMWQTVSRAINTSWQGEYISALVPRMNLPEPFGNIRSYHVGLMNITGGVQAYILTDGSASLTKTSASYIASPQNIASTRDYKISYRIVGND